MINDWSVQILSNSNFVKCPICMDKGVIIFKIVKGVLSYDTTAKCVCPSGNKYSGIANIQEAGFDLKEIAKENIDKYNMELVDGGCIKHFTEGDQIELIKSNIKIGKFETLEVDFEKDLF